MTQPNPDEPQAVTVSRDQLLRWAAALALSHSRFSLLFHRGNPAWWGTPGMLARHDLEDALLKASMCETELLRLLTPFGVTSYDLARAMSCPSWDRAFWRPPSDHP